jgi:hypothetical protein
MEHFSKDYFFKAITDSLVSKAHADGKKGMFILHRLVEPQAFGALKCFRFNIFYIGTGNESILIDSWEFKMKVTETAYEEDIKPLYVKMLNAVYNLLESDKYKELV